MAKLNTMYLDYAVGTGAALRGVENTTEALKNTLLLTANFLTADIAEISPLIENKLGK